MPNNPKISSHVAAYVDTTLKQRAQRITKLAPRLTTSRIIEECLVGHLPKIERRVAGK
jgi:hypothetical protein